MNEKSKSLIYRSDTRVSYFSDGNQYHREDGPATIFKKRRYSLENFWCWYFHDETHCESGPAVYEHDGTLMWYRNGKIHRTDGPAKIVPGLAPAYALDGRFMTLEDFQKHHLIIHLTIYEENIEAIQREYEKWCAMDYSHEFARFND